MDNWKIQLVVVIFCALVQTYQGLSHNADDERTPSEDWQHETLKSALTNPVAGLMKKSKALRFYGLMGKRSETKKQFQVNRRNKGGMFVGLMGRSISSGESLTSVIPSATTTQEKTQKQGSEEWMQILH